MVIHTDAVTGMLTCSELTCLHAHMANARMLSRPTAHPSQKKAAGDDRGFRKMDAHCDWHAHMLTFHSAAVGRSNDERALQLVACSPRWQE